MLVSEHVYPVALTFKITERVEQRSASNFAWGWDIPLWKLFGWFGRPQLWANGDWQLHHDNPLMHHVLCRGFWWNIKLSRWLSPSIAQIWCPATSGFSQNKNHLWKGRDFRPVMRLRKIRWGSWWQWGELCEVPRCLLWKELRRHCPMHNVPFLFFHYF